MLLVNLFFLFFYTYILFDCFDHIKCTTIMDESHWNKIIADDLDLDYCETFLTSAEAASLMEYMENNIRYLEGQLTRVKVFGRYYVIPRQQVAFGDDNVSYKFSGTVVPAKPWPAPLLQLKDKIRGALGYDYNFVLVNRYIAAATGLFGFFTPRTISYRYRNGEDHIGEHRDDEAELDKTVPIASVSLGQTRKLVFKHIDARKKIRKVDTIKLSLHHRSLLMMNTPTNKFWYHSVPKEKKASHVRLNLTFRKIKWTKKCSLFPFGIQIFVCFMIN